MQQTVEGVDRHAGVRRPAEPDARRWVTALAPYREPSLTRSVVEFVVTVVPFVAFWLLMLLSLRYSWWLCLLFAVPAVGLLVRLFMIQHDCLRLALWDEDQHRLVGFRDARSLANGFVGARRNCEGASEIAQGG